MDQRKAKAIFADKKLENDYRRLSTSKHSEDKKLRKNLKIARDKLKARHQHGKEIHKRKIPSIYKQMFHIDNLWTLDVSPKSNVLYSFDGNTILIVDMP